MKLFLKQNFKKVKQLVAFLIIAFSINTNAQTLFTLSGKVVDGNQPLTGASILIKGTSKGTTSDLHGNFKFQLKKGNYTLVVSAISKPKEIKVNLNKNKSITINMADSFVNLEEVLVNAVRVKESSPVTHSNITKEELAKRNLGQDIPILLNYLPSVVTTSDAGAGIGYTGIRVRGSDATRVNVTINGIPYNDAESQGTYWVNLPDFASSTQSIQLQRGVGTSTNGSAAFGASLNILTDAISKYSYGEISSSIGSFNTSKNTVKFSTGKINNHIEFAGRFSKIDSDGYIDRAFSNLKSYFLQAAYVDDNTLIKALTFGGKEKTYQAWYGVTKEEMATLGRTYNPYSYDNETDNYQQDHFQILWNQKLSKNWSSNIALNYTKGKGYYEQYKANQNFADYNLIPITIGGETIDKTDLIRRRWLDNDYYVANANATYKNNSLEIIFGTSVSYYKGGHFGEIIWAQYASDSQIREHYYNSNTKKNDANIFGKLTYKLTNKWMLFTDLQGRFVRFKTAGITSDIIPIKINKNYSFFNPKAGLTFKANNSNSIYFSVAKATKEPNRNDFKYGVNTAEKLTDFELGWRYKSENVAVNTNIYYMKYKDQLVLTGAIDDTGDFIRATSGKSYRLGLEIDGKIKLNNRFNWQPNIAISSNKNLDFVTSWNGELVSLGKTNLSFSPKIVAGNSFTYAPNTKMYISLLSKYVGEQYMGNIDNKNSKLESYFVNDLNFSYEIKPKKIIKSIVFTALLNNIFNVEYISNGYYYTYDDTWSVPGETTTLDGAGYYPQATRNFLVGATLKF
ncbi:TonB-dependent receptor [Lutibacter profundi]|uniref:TonB-dependent receptor n=1 Tax=Lutibacter profundi TaxID=1622118 RepID=A0A0X8G7Y2_9FLAO|nr:TonB-dependent receptor [Lutibacter profundi]AMC11676.1 TonB-dependent receptor [Lutibacter profundi]